MIELLAEGFQLHSGAPWWLVQNGLDEREPISRATCDVAVVGAGITGALVADALTAAGLDVMLIDRRAPGGGSTAVSTALLQYELDVSLVDLTRRIGRTDAERAYRLFDAAIDRIATIVADLPDDCGFERRPSLYLASRRRDTRRLNAECSARVAAGLDCTVWDAATVRQRYELSCHGALRSTRGAVLDPVRLMRALLALCIERGAAILPRTTVERVEARSGKLLVRTDRGVVRAGQVVLALGYEIPPKLHDDLITLQSTYALVTEPLDDIGPLGDGCLVWESARPYTYLRTTADGRVIIGGEDTPFKSAIVRDQLLPTRVRRLERRLKDMLGGRPARTEFAWAGTFAETTDGLPIVGAVAGLPGVWTALGYGGNGITAGVIAADMLGALCQGRPHAEARLFRPDR